MKPFLYWCGITGAVLLAALFFRFVANAHWIVMGLLLALLLLLIRVITSR